MPNCDIEEIKDDCGAGHTTKIYKNRTGGLKDVRVWVRNRGNCKIRATADERGQSVYQDADEWTRNDKTFVQDIVVPANGYIYLSCWQQDDTNKKAECHFEWKIK